MLSGVHENVRDQLLKTETTEDIPEDAIFMATATLGESTRAAVAAAEVWLAEQAHAEVVWPEEKHNQSNNSLIDG